MEYMSLDTLTSWYCRKNVVEDVTVKKRKSPGTEAEGPDTSSKRSVVIIIADIVKSHLDRARLTGRPLDTAPKNKPYCIDW